MRRFKYTSRGLALLTCLLLSMGVSAQPNDLVLAISEGTSGGLDHSRVIAKYGGLANVLGQAIKRKVVVVFVREFAQLEEGMKTARYDLVMARPSDYPARGVRDYGYRYVASAKPDGQCLVLVPKTSSIQTLDQARGKRWVLPEQAAYMTKFCTAELRDKGIDLAKENVNYVREQASIGSYMESSFADIGGAASYSGLAQSWEKAGHRVLHKSVAQPYFPLIAGKTVSAKAVEAMQKELLQLPASTAGQDLLKTVGIAEFDTSGAQRLSNLLGWLQKK